MYMNININIWNINMNMHMGHEHQHVLFLLPAIQLCRARSTRQEAQNAGFKSCIAHALHMPSTFRFVSVTGNSTRFVCDGFEELEVS